MTNLSEMISSGSIPFHFLVFDLVNSFCFYIFYNFLFHLVAKLIGYRHVRLLSNLGEALENTTLFVHVAISDKWAGEVVSLFQMSFPVGWFFCVLPFFIFPFEQQLLPKSRSKHGKKQAVIRMTGLRQLDDHFKVNTLYKLMSIFCHQNSIAVLLTLIETWL